MPSDVADPTPVADGPFVVDAGSMRSDVVVGDLLVVMVVCLVTVITELFGIVWVIPESVMVVDFFGAAAVVCDEAVDCVCCL